MISGKDEIVCRSETGREEAEEGEIQIAKKGEGEDRKLGENAESKYNKKGSEREFCRLRFLYVQTDTPLERNN